MYVSPWLMVPLLFFATVGVFALIVVVKVMLETGDD